MKKLKLNFGEGGLQGWLIRHVEKFVLVLFAAVMVWFVISGSRLEGMKTAQTPDELKTKAQETVSYVNAPRWDVVQQQPERRVDAKVEVSVKEMLSSAANSDNYRLPRNWNEPLSPKLQPREDPSIFAPLRLKVVSISGPFAFAQEEGDVDPLEPIVTDEEDPKKPKAKKPTPKPKAKKAAGPPGMPGMAGMEGMGMPGVGKASKKGKGSGTPPSIGGTPPGMDGMMPPDEGAMPGMMGGMPGMPGMTGMGGGHVDSMIIGYRPPATSTVRIARANVVMAVVPYEKQAEEFDAKLATSLDYEPQRDKPHYLFFSVKRLDVTDDPSIDPASIPDDKWADLGINASLDAIQTWAGAPTDIMDPFYLMPVYRKGLPGLTHPLPPFVQRNLWEAMTHPDIPLAAPANVVPDPAGRRRPKKAGDAGDSPDEIPTSGGVAGNGPPGIGMPGMGGGMPGMSGMPGMPGMGAPGGPGMGGAEGGVPPGIGMPGMAGMEGAMPGMGMPGMGGGMPGMGAYGMAEKLVKYKLIRFNDFTVEPGHKYRYKVRVIVEDPNYPSASYAAPSLAGLAEDVRVRVRKIEAQDEARKDGRKRTYRDSPWSAPSEVASLPPTEWFYAGKAEPEPASPIPGTKFKYRTGEPSATALTVLQDEKKAVDVPAKHQVYRGSAINFTPDEVEVIHPVYGDKHKLEKYNFQTNAVVADILGGEEIPLVIGTHDHPFKAPGELLFVDAAGNMHVQDEVDDIENFHRFLGPQEEDGAKKKKDDQPALSPPGFDGMMGLPGSGVPPGIPGAAPAGKSKR